ncbi:LysE family translocator [Trichothermofontia sichuanensis B231]|uniref:LysE/ArgO family amino acid transporter n=1 Tax=Trichothermofontia sichuanensis TaxID=3045816 RepID=UPI0022478BFB|nr:LysE family transporter [Trichothermofontia sichuanensis]UZQ56309.1 LysE family translocator [Trichothermofontia sichuanensis B231]
MDLGVLFKGMAIGLAIAAPVGPIGVLCIRRTLAEGQLVGLLSGLGAATADAVYGAIAGFGLTLAADFLLSYAIGLQLIGGLFLCYLGVRTFLTSPATEAATVAGQGLLGAYASTFFLTLTNPATILAFMGVLTGLGILSSDCASAALLVLGVFLGSALWWLILSKGVSLLRTRLTQTGLQWLNQLAGVVIFAFGLLTLLPDF